MIRRGACQVILYRYAGSYLEIGTLITFWHSLELMATRCITEFTLNSVPMAKVYRHFDGYPEGAGTDIHRFLADVKAQAPDDTRFDDPWVLAARYVVWLAGRGNTRFNPRTGEDEKLPPLAFHGISICLSGPGDEAYVYRVRCDDADNDTLPVVTCHHVKLDGMDGAECEIPMPGDPDA